MKLFITGVCGQLGSDVLKEALKRGYDCIGCDILESCSEKPNDFGASFSYVQGDIRDKNETEKIILEAKPDGIIHCAAWTAVDKAEEKENYGDVMALNVTGTENIARAAKLAGAKMMYISTDYVFDGSGTSPRRPEDEASDPLNVYGRSKLLGEKAVTDTLTDFFIVRTAWVFGKNGNNFVRTMLNLGDKYSEIRVVNDQIGTPTYTPDLAKLLVDMIETDKFGIYHATNSEEREGEYISWYDFAREIFSRSGQNVTVIPVSTSEYGKSLALRPFNSRLDKSKLTRNGFELLPPWKDALVRYLRETEIG